jgi:flagellar basal body-associated protein FliL
MADIQIEPRSRRSPWLWILVIVVLIAIALGAWYLLGL